MTSVEMALVLLAGVGAGAVNTIVGSGTLITFPTLVAFGVPPVSATMSNALGLVPGNITGSFGYRRELAGQWRRLARMVPLSIAGALGGALLLLHLPPEAFESIVPALIILAVGLVLTQPLVQRFLRSRTTADDAQPSRGAGNIVAVGVVILVCAVYGGYFAAAQGVLLVGFLGLLLSDSLQHLNAMKNVLVLAVNTVAATTYVVVGWSRIEWSAVGLIALGSTVGGYLGAQFGRKLHPVALRACIVVLSLIALWRMWTA